EQAKLVGSDEVAFDFFGYSVAISLNTVVIGAFGSDDRGIGSGSAYVFEREGTTVGEGERLLAGGRQSGDNFGVSVAVSVDTVAVGAVGAKDRGEGAGAVYVFERRGTTWIEQAKLLASDGKAGDHFGSSLAISTDRVVVGAPGNEDSGSCSGSTYVFE